MRWAIAAAMAAVALGPAAGQVKNPPPTRAAGEKQYAQIRERVLRQLGAKPKAKGMVLVKTAGTTTEVPVMSGATKFDTEVPDCQLAMRIWFELRDGANAGKLVNPQRHPFAPKERFWLWVDTAVPVQLALFQNYPDSGTPTRQVVPDEAYPTTFATVPPGQPWRFPLPFAMDDDLRTEYMALVVARSDSGYVPPNGAVAAPLSGDGPVAVNAEVQVAMKLDGGKPFKGSLRDATRRSFDLMYRAATGKGAVDGKSTKFTILPPDPTDPPVSPRPDDVSLLLFGPGQVGHVQLELSKKR